MRELLRKNIACLVPYSSARSDFQGNASIWLDANENWQDFVGDKGINRYPDPLCKALRKKIEEVMGLPYENTVLGNGSDEVIDNLIRCFCEPGKDSILLMPPTYGAYRVFADVNDVFSVNVPLSPDLRLDLPALKKAFASQSGNNGKGGRLKMVFICSPNNPTGGAQALSDIREVADSFDGITVVDEAYEDFSSQESAVTLLPGHPNLVVLRTFSKCWGLAGARVGILVASPEIRKVVESMKYPYNLSALAQREALRALENADAVREGRRTIIAERQALIGKLRKLPCVKDVYPSDANFLLVKTTDAGGIYRHLVSRGIVVRNRSKELYCEGGLRVAVGSPGENEALVAALKEWKA